VILGVDLGHFDPSRAANETQTAKRILGSRLLGIEIGNEPDAYGAKQVKLRPSSYSVLDYMAEAAVYAGSIHTVSPDVSLFGPDLSGNPEWLSRLASTTHQPFGVLTEHLYPTLYSVAKAPCKGTPVPTAADLLAPEVRDGENGFLQVLANAARVARRRVRISETNDTASCDAPGGPATSPVFASALWSLDWVLRAASTGVAGLNFHGNFGLCLPNTFSPICAPTAYAFDHGQVTARPEYYGLFAARQLEGGDFVPVALSGRNTSEALAVYATEHRHETVTVAIDSFAVAGSGPLRIKLRGAQTASAEFLEAPSVSATTGVSFGRSSFDATGELNPVRVTLAKRRGYFYLEMHRASAVIVTLRR
jgi:hypothetical protein